MRILIDKIVAFLIISYGRYLKNMSWEKVKSSGEKVGRMLYHLSKKRYRITIENIKSSFPDKSNSEIEAIAKQSYETLGITMAELLKASYSTDTEVLSRVVYSNPLMISRTLGKGKGLILLSGHYGNWEFLAITAGLIQEETVNVIVKYQNNDNINKKLIKARAKWGNNIIDMGKAARPMMEIINNKGILALLADQRATKDKDIYVDFFGRKAATYEAPAALSYKYDIPIIMGFANRMKDGRYKVDLIEVKRDGLENYDNPIEELTRRHVILLESEIRKNPGNWAWQHNRWKY